MRASRPGGRTVTTHGKAMAARLEAVAALAEERGEELMGTLFRLLSTMFEDMGRLERKIHMLEDETGIGIDR